MKKFYSLALAALVALSAAAAPVAFKKVEGKMPHKVNTIPGVKAHKNVADISKTVVPIANGRQVLDADYEDPEDPIEAPEIIVAPEGTPQAMTNSALGFVNSFFGIMYTQADYPAEVVWGDNDEVYIKGVIGSVANCYVRGKLVDGKVEVKLPQICYFEYLEEYDELFVAYATVMESFDYEEDGEEYVGYQNCEPQTIVYEVGEDGSLTLTLNGTVPTQDTPEHIIGLCDDPTAGVVAWFGYGDSYQTFTEVNEEVVTVPEGVQFENWIVEGGYDGPVYVKVGFDGDDVYVLGLFPELPDAAVKGHVEGETVVFPCGQYMGDYKGYNIFFGGVEWEDFDFENYEMLDEFVFNYDAEGKKMTTDNELIDLLINNSKDDRDPWYYYANPTISYVDPALLDAAPEDPYVVYFEHNFERSWGTNEGYIEWVIPAMNVEGMPLPTDRMCYNFYVDGEVKTFSPDEYVKFDQEYVDVPWNFSDGWDIEAFGDVRDITFFEEEYESFGLQSFYVNEEGTRFASNLVTYTPEPEDGVEGVAVDNKVLRSVEYFNLNGQRIANPGNGLYIVRQNYTDGTAKVAKVVVK